MRLADKHSDDPNLHQAIDIAWDKAAAPYNFRFTIKVPYFNPKEAFGISIFFDKKSDNVKVLCRIEDVRCTIRDPDYIYSHALGAVVLRGVLKGIANETPVVRGVFR